MDTPVSGLSKKPKLLPSEKDDRSHVTLPRDNFGSDEDVVLVGEAGNNSVAVAVIVDVEDIVGEDSSVAVSDGVIG
jgi:hypothetical protein